MLTVNLKLNLSHFSLGFKITNYQILIINETLPETSSHWIFRKKENNVYCRDIH